jgi:hypothetical protein
MFIVNRKIPIPTFADHGTDGRYFREVLQVKRYILLLIIIRTNQLENNKSFA